MVSFIFEGNILILWFYYVRLFCGVIVSLLLNFSFKNTSGITGLLAFNFVD